MPPSERAQRFLESLRTHGGRVSAPRRIIVEALLASEHHVTAEDLAATVQAENPEIHLTTVYRTLDALEGLGLVYHVHLGHGPAQWHLADDSHLHLLCQGCGKVSEAPDDFISRLVTGFEGTFDFTPDPRHFSLVGWCTNCRPRH